MQIQHVQQVMTPSLHCCQASDNLGHAAKLMCEHDCGVIPIVDDEMRVIAVITDRDICMAAYAKDKKLTEIGVRPTMSQGLVVCHPEDRVDLAEELMRTHQMRRLPVVNAKGQLVGMLALHDLVRAAEQASSKGCCGTNGVRLKYTARTLAAICASYLSSVGAKLV